MKEQNRIQKVAELVTPLHLLQLKIKSVELELEIRLRDLKDMKVEHIDQECLYKKICALRKAVDEVILCIDIYI